MLRTLAKSIARRLGLTVIAREHLARPFADHPPHTTFDLALVHHFRDLQGLNFIQVGANDGARYDPIVSYVDSCNWSGLMFEPLAANHAALERRHGGNPRVQVRRQAIDATADRRAMYDLDRAAHPNLPDWANGLGSFSQERLLTACRELGLETSAIVTEQVYTVTWGEVWRDFGPRRCDLLVIDAEGEDIRLLRLAGLARHRPRLICFEHACSNEADRLAFYGELLQLGYELTTQGGDTIAHLSHDSKAAS